LMSRSGEDAEGEGEGGVFNLLVEIDERGKKNREKAYSA